jgi:hypothetical protein
LIIFVGFYPTYLLNISPKDWQFSSFKKFVKQGFYQEDWCNFDDKNCVLNMDLE